MKTQQIITTKNGKKWILKGGKLFAYGGNLKDEYGNYEAPDYTQLGNNTTNQTVSGVVSGATSGMSMGPIGAAVGAVVGGVTGLITSGVENTKYLKEHEEARLRDRARREDISKTIMSSYPTKGVSGVTAFYGLGGRMKYALGGGMQQQGGNFEPVASDTQVVDGNTHEQGGVSVGGNEVENNEVMKQQGDGSTNVYSDRLEVEKGVTFAQKAAEIAKRKGKYEEKLEDSSIFVKGTARREIQKLDADLQRLFMQQEMKKQEMGIPDPNQQAQLQQQNPAIEATNMNKVDAAAEQVSQGMEQPQLKYGGKMLALGGTMGGGKPPKWLKDYYYNLKGASDKSKDANKVDPRDSANLANMEASMREATQEEGAGVTTTTLSKPMNWGKVGQYAQKILPYADNIVNTVLTATTPRIPKPVPYRTVPLKTDYNIAPQLAEIDATEVNTTKALTSQTASSSDLRANIIASKAGLVSARNKLYGEKANIETSLINADRQNTQQIGNLNVDKETLYRNMQLQREGEIQRRISENVANSVADAQQQIREENLKKRDYMELDLLKQQYKDSGVWDRNIEALFQAYLKGDITYEEFAAKRPK